MNALRKIDEMAVKYRWVAHVLLWSGVATFAWMVFDREPPFAVIAVEPAYARPGDFVVITAKVRRDVDRQCKAELSRIVIDSSGTRFDLITSRYSAASIAAIEKRTPGILKTTFQVPTSAATGVATVIGDASYECNRAHGLWPISVRSELPFMVLPLHQLKGEDDM